MTRAKGLKRVEH
jgi:hypothetical protein